MRMIRTLVSLCLLAPSLGAQTAAPLTVVGPDGKETVLSASAIAALPRVSGRASAHGNEFSYDGPELRAVLQLAGIKTDSLRGPMLRRVVKIVAADGYIVVLALSDLDPSIGARHAVLADREDGSPLPAESAPRHIIVVGDVRPTRWARQVVRLVVSDVP